MWASPATHAEGVGGVRDEGGAAGVADLLEHVEVLIAPALAIPER
jgi:hypothetical protein